jgi:cysteine synthase A
MLKVNDLPLACLIGNTPLYKLAIETGGADVYIKLEGNNPGGSIKDRAAWGMLNFAQHNCEIKANSVIVESTSGNTGIGLALLGKALGLHVILTMPDSMSVERRAVLKAFGAELVLTPASQGMKGASDKAQEIAAKEKNAFIPDQFANPGNPWAHEQTTGPEILSQVPKDKNLAAFVASFGSGGTITGVGRALRKVFPDVDLVAVEPASSPLVTEGRLGSHEIEGIGANFIPKNLDRTLVTHYMTVTDEASFETTKWLAAEEGIFSGISTGANVWAAIETAKKLPKNSIVVTVQPDRGDKYLSIF